MTVAPAASSTVRHESAIGPRTMPDDEFTKEALMIRVDRKLNSTDVVDALTDLFMPHAGHPSSFGPTMAQNSSR